MLAKRPREAAPPGTPALRLASASSVGRADGSECGYAGYRTHEVLSRGRAGRSLKVSLFGGHGELWYARACIQAASK